MIHDHGPQELHTGVPGCRPVPVHPGATLRGIAADLGISRHTRKIDSAKRQVQRSRLAPQADPSHKLIRVRRYRSADFPRVVGHLQVMAFRRTLPKAHSACNNGGMDLEAGNDEWLGRDAVFVSYSHVDEEWAQAFQVMLTPVLENFGIELWVDTEIRTGSYWDPEIEKASARSGVALLLVSKDFLASEYIMRNELPGLIRHHVRLAPVLIGSCLYGQVPGLADVQWLHDPGKDGALNLFADQPGERDRRICRACERLLLLLPHPTTPTTVAISRPERNESVAEVPVGAVTGARSGVPGAPPGYVARDELARLIEAISAVESGAVGVVGHASTFGLHGQGGIGKTVLAAAVARDESVARRFPDGIYWVTVGESADIVATQLDLLNRLGPTGPIPSTSREVERALRALLANRRILLIIDDVWSDAAALAFRLTGPMGRVLYTTRDPQVLIAVRARAFPVEVLSLAAARALAAAVIAAPDLSVDVNSLPPDADTAIEQVGRVALAVALLAAAVRGGKTWSHVTAELLRDADVFGDHPYANTFKAMQIGVAALPSELADALVSLAVLPQDARPPIAAVARYWAHTRGLTTTQTIDDLRRLASANLLSLNYAGGNDTDSGSIEFHDLQHDYLVLHAPALSALHAQILAAYRTLIPDRRPWSQLPPDEPYIWDELVTHLRRAGARHELAATVVDPAFLVQRIAAAGVLLAEHDLDGAAATLPDNKLIAWWRTWLPRYAHIFALADDITGIRERTRAIVPTFLGWLGVDPTRPPEIIVERLFPLCPALTLQARWGLQAPSSAQIRVLRGHSGRVTGLAWLADSTHLVTAGQDGRLLWWDTESSEPPTTLIDSGTTISSIALSPNGSQLAVVHQDGQIDLWNPASQQPVRTLGKQHGTKSDSLVAWAPDSSLLAITVEDRVLLWNPKVGRVAATIRSRSRPVAAIAWSPDSRRLATASANGLVQLWDPMRSSRLGYTIIGSPTYAMGWSPDGSKLIVGGYEGRCHQVAALNMTPEQPRRDPVGTAINHVGHVRAIAWSPDGAQLVTAGDDGQVRLWVPTGNFPHSVKASSALRTTLTGHTSSVRAVAWSPDALRLATASIDGQVRLWDPLSAAGATKSSHSGHTRATAWSPDGTCIVTAGQDGEVRLWQPDTGQIIATLTESIGQAGPVHAVCWSRANGRLAIARTSPEVLVWNSEAGRIEATLNGHTDWVRAVAWSPDGTRLATAGTRGQVRLWDPVAKALTAVLAREGTGIYALAWSPDGTQLIAAGEDGSIRAWRPSDENSATWRSRLFAPRSPQARVLVSHASAATAVVWSADGRRLASGGADGNVRVWDHYPDKSTVILKSASRMVHALCWWPDGFRLAVSWSDGEVGVHDIRSRTEAVRFRLGSASCIDWMDNRIVAAGLDNVVMLTLSPAPTEPGRSGMMMPWPVSEG